MSRRLPAVFVANLVGLVLSMGATSAQVNPTDMRSGVAGGVGQHATVTLFSVPSGFTFVLTDLSWSPDVAVGDLANPFLRLRPTGGPNFMWELRVTYNFANSNAVLYVSPIQEHWMIGLVFNADSQVEFEVFGFIENRPWRVSWSGYLTPTLAGAVSDQRITPQPVVLQQNVPNPFNPTTEIRYTLTAPGRADLRIYDAAGRLVRTLEQGSKNVGEHVVIWDGRDDSGRVVASGVYYYELGTASGRETRKAVILR